VHRGSVAGSGVLGTHPACGRALRAVYEFVDRLRGWVLDQQVHVVGFAVELDRLGSEDVANLAEGGLAVGEYGVVEDALAVLGHEDEVGVEQRYRAAGSSVVRLRLRQECRSF
jgi:hypothetical protein